MICDEPYRPEKIERCRKMTFCRWLTQFRNEQSFRGKMVQFMVTHKDFPMKSRGVFDGFDYFVENNMKSYAECFRENYDVFRCMNIVNTLTIKNKCSIRRTPENKKP